MARAPSRERDQQASRVHAPISLHEAGKARRRARIVDAAAALLREAGVEQVSIHHIAQRAEVSPATVYNLFGAKAAVLRQVFDRDMRRFEALMAEAPARNALDRLFKSTRLAVSLYGADPRFYRAMVNVGAAPLHALISEPRIAFCRAMLQQAQTDGYLATTANLDALSVAMSQLARGAISHWASGAISLDRLEKEIVYGQALLLLTSATRRGAPDLKARLQTHVAGLTLNNRAPRAAAHRETRT